MTDLATLDTQIAALETAVTTVAAGRVAQWGDRMITLESLPNIRAELTALRRERSGLVRRAAGDRSSARYRTASFS